MNKLNSLSSYNSGTSSEASETQSTEENQSNDSIITSISNSSSRIPKSRVRMKDGSNELREIGSKRPPWRAVSISTLPKPDKNALLKAKLLDVSRRLRANKATVGVQADCTVSRLTKEVGTSAQIDLILHKEHGVMTDGSYTRISNGGQEYILTYSIPLMTDAIETMDMATQTLLPKVPGDAFLAAYMGHQLDNDKLYNQCSDTEKKLLQQLKLLPTSMNSLINNLAKYNNNFVDFTAGQRPSRFTKSQNNSLNNRPTLLQPTLLSWRFDDKIDGRNLSKSSLPSWPKVLPVPLNRHRYIDWNILLSAIRNLIYESKRLADLVELISTQTNKHKINTSNATRKDVSKQFAPKEHKLPSEYWLPIIEEQEKQLAAIKTFQPANLDELHSFLKDNSIN